MRKLLITVGFIFCFSPWLLAQPLESKILSRLLREPNAVTHISHLEMRGLFLEKIDPKYRANKQYFVKSLDGLFFGVEGTGCIYRVVGTDNGKLDVIRMDSTVYAGNNFCAANFTIDSSIYSFGGYGFWRTNGLLKTFNKYSREWDAIPISAENPSIYCEAGSGIFWENVDSASANNRKFGTNFAPSQFWVDTSRKLFYQISQRKVNEAVLDRPPYSSNYFIPVVNQLNLVTKQWTSLGNLIDYGWHHQLQTPWGLLVMENADKISLADFNKNQKRYCAAPHLPLYRKFFVNNPPQVYFYAGGFIYMGSPRNGLYDSIPFSLEQFLPPVHLIYTAHSGSGTIEKVGGYISSPWVMIPSGLLGGLLLGLLIFGNNKLYFRRNRSLFNKGYDHMVAANERLNMLTAIEKSLISLVATNSLRGVRTSIDEVNKVIGVSGKNEPIKRRVRSEVINSINEKWIIIAGIRERLIESAKSEEDKRAREYFIVPEILASPVFNSVINEQD